MEKIHIVRLENPKLELNGRAVGWASPNMANPARTEEQTPIRIFHISLTIRKHLVTSKSQS